MSRKTFKPETRLDTFAEVILSGFSQRLAQQAESLPSTRCMARPALIRLLSNLRDDLAIPGTRAISGDALLGILARSGLIKPIEITALSPRVSPLRFYAIGMDTDPQMIEPAELLQTHAPDGVICYFSALQLHNLTTQPAPHHHIARSRPAAGPSPAKPLTIGESAPALGSGQFRYQGVAYYVCMRDFSILRKSQQQYLHGRSKVHVTTLEQTLVDTLHRPMNAGGPSVVFEAWEAAAERANVDTLLKILLEIRDPLLARRVGFMIEQTLGPFADADLDAVHALAQRTLTTETGQLPSLMSSMPYKTIDARWQLRIP